MGAPLTKSGDPRAKQLPLEAFAQAAQKIVAVFLAQVAVTQNQQAELAEAEKAPKKQLVLNHKSVQVCRFQVAKLISDDHELQSGLKLVQNSALSYDYYYLQAVLQQEDPLHVDLVRIDLLTRALEIAIDSDDASGVFLTILRLV